MPVTFSHATQTCITSILAITLIYIWSKHLLNQVTDLFLYSAAKHFNDLHIVTKNSPHSIRNFTSNYSGIPV